jgi:hypothetical protein
MLGCVPLGNIIGRAQVRVIISCKFVHIVQ